MKSKRQVIHIVKHLPTGAKVPVVIDKMIDNKIIEKYHEHTKERKGFTLQMLQDRWDLSQEDTLELLQKYQVPAHVNHQDVLSLEKDKQPVVVAIFFEEYIYGIEKKTGMPHNKLKARSLHKNIKEH